MTLQTLDAEPACSGSDATQDAPEPATGNPATRSATTGSAGAGVAADAVPALRAERRAFETIDRSTWDGLAARNPWATPFSAWAFQRAWWDAYGDNAHDETLVVVAADAPTDGTAEPVAIVPLMHRHEVEPTDAAMHTTMRRGHDPELTPVPPDATAIFFGASYHADYATILTAPADLPAVADAVAAHLASTAADWDVVDLRRLRCGDPTADALVAALRDRATAEGWSLDLEREEVCPVVSLPADGDMETYLNSLGKKERHEIRRKVRRAEAVGEIRLDEVTEPLADLDTFIDFHQRKWGERGLFPPTVGGDQSRVFVRRLFELMGPGGPARLTFLSVGGRRIASGIHFETVDGYLYYNAGVDPEARELSPGVVMVYAYVERAMAAGKRRMDFLRGNEPYKYEWGAKDEPIQRVLLRRRDS